MLVIILIPFDNQIMLDSPAWCLSTSSNSFLDPGMPRQVSKLECWLDLRFSLLAHFRYTDSHYSLERA